MSKEFLTDEQVAWLDRYTLLPNGAWLVKTWETEDDGDMSSLDRHDHQNICAVLISARKMNDEIARLRGLVKDAYEEGYGCWADEATEEFEHDWETSDARKALEGEE